MSDQRIDDISTTGHPIHMTRRTLLRRASVLGMSLPIASLLLQACGDDDDGPTSTPASSAGDPTSTADTEPGSDDDEPADDETPEQAPPGGDGPAGELVVAQGPEITSLDWAMSSGMLNFNVMVHMMEPLVMRGDDMLPHPHLAESIEQVDEVTVRFTIRQDATFHNGDPLTVDDVVYTLRLISDPESGSDLYRYANTVVSVEALDDQTVEVVLSEPDVTFVGRMTLVPIASRQHDEALDDSRADATPMGTGPFQFVNWQRGDRVTLEAYDDYWGDPPGIQSLVFRGIPEDATRVAELQTGAAGLITNLPTHLVTQLESESNTSVLQTNSLRTIFAVLNTHKPPFDDVRVRRAANFGVDKDLIVEALLDGFSTPTSQPFGEEVFGYNPALSDYYSYDPDLARQLLEEAGYDGSVPVNFYSPVGRYLKDEEVSQNIAAQLEEVGFRVNLNFLEWQAYFDSFFGSGIANEDLDIGFFSNANNTADADYNLSLNVHSGGRGLYWVNTEVDQMIDQARQVVDLDEREALYHEILDVMVPEAVWLFLYTQHDLYGTASNLEGWQPRADEMIYLHGARLGG